MPTPKGSPGSPSFAMAPMGPGKLLPRSFVGRAALCIGTPIAFIFINSVVTSWPWISSSRYDSVAPQRAEQTASLDPQVAATDDTSKPLAAARRREPAARRMPEQRHPQQGSGEVIRKSKTVWAIQQGPLLFEVSLGEPELKEKGSKAALVEHKGEDCYTSCHKGGLCNWCGAGNACCRKGFDGMDPEICQHARGYTKVHHECVEVSEISHPGAKVTLSHDGIVVLSSPLRALWSVGRALQHGWPTAWDEASINGEDMISTVGPWLIAEGSIRTPDGSWAVKDKWRIYDGTVEGLRDWQWTGAKKSNASVLSVAWTAVRGHGPGLFMPAAVYHGNPSGTRSGATVYSWRGDGAERVQVEEHRLAQPWASFEWETSGRRVVGALEAVPSAPPFAKHPDLTWTLGAEEGPLGVTLQSLSGALALNGAPGFSKTGSHKKTPFTEVGLYVPPLQRIQKRYRLHAAGPVQPGAGFRVPLDWSITRGDLSADSMPRFGDIVEAKVRFALSRWSSENTLPGFCMYPGNMDIYTMGWAGQAEAPGYALQVLADRMGQPELKTIGHQALDSLSQAPFNDHGFKLELNGDTGKWKGQDPVSQGQAMSAFARAISYARRTGSSGSASKWEAFLSRALDIHAARILEQNWYPRSTAEAFIIQPLAMGAKLFGKEMFLHAALKAGEHYRERHVGLKEPFWGGTLDASCEDKEGAWAGFEAFLALYEATGDNKWLEAASYAGDFVLTYTYLWDVQLPPGRLRDHDLKTRGWTGVSVQNMHLDVYGVLYTPRLWRLGQLTNRPELLRVAELMYRSCGQMIDIYGSQGEQLQQTRYAQAGDLSNPERFRGGYVESWTVFWIAAHFLTAAAQFEELGVLSDLWDKL